MTPETPLCQVLGDQVAYELTATIAQAINDRVPLDKRRAVLEALRTEIGIGITLEGDSIVVGADLLR